MYDPRLGWLKYFLSGNDLLVVPQIKRDESTITTFLDDIATDPAIRILDQKISDSVFLPQPITKEKTWGNLLYMIRSRESSRTIYRKLAACDQGIVAEYAVLPSWRNPRWFVPKDRSLGIGRMPLMINPARPLSRAAIMGFRLLKWVNQGQLVFNDRLVVCRKRTNNSGGLGGLDDTILGQIGKRFREQVYPGVIYTGSFGPIQKFTIELLNGAGRPVAFAKIGHNKFSNEAIEREGLALALLYSFDIETIQVPRSLGVFVLERWGEKVLLQSLLEGGKKNQGLSGICIKGLLDLFHATRRDTSVPLQEYVAGIRAQLDDLGEDKLSGQYLQTRDYISGKLAHVGNKFQDSPLPLALSHGDFTRWNVREDHQTLYVIDWEEAAFRAPGHDLFNLLFSEVLQVRKQGPDEVIADFTEAIGEHASGTCASYFDATLHGSPLKPELLAILYLAEKIAYSLWHVKQHLVGGYPEKESFGRIIAASAKIFGHFCSKIESGMGLS